MRPLARKPTTVPRKRPTQERARATVDAILAATARVLVADGLERATTNRIARVAGVSIGSLYQYFPNKQALVRALYERHLEKAESVRPPALRAGAAERGRGAAGRARRASLRDVIGAAVAWHLAVHAEEPGLHQELAANAARILGDDAVRAFERAYEARIRRRLEGHRREIRPCDLGVAAFLVATCMEAVTHAAVLRHPEMLAGGDLAGELAEMILRYLERRTPARARGDRRGARAR